MTAKHECGRYVAPGQVCVCISGPARYCVRGHDTHETGRVHGRCRRCRSEDSTRHSRERREREGRTAYDSLRLRHLPLDPLIPLVSRYRTRLNSRLVDGFAHAKLRGRITMSMGDEIATAMGFHPCEVWGELWWQEATG